jgi:hypothetical protein
MRHGCAAPGRSSPLLCATARTSGSMGAVAQASTPLRDTSGTHRHRWKRSRRIGSRAVEKSTTRNNGVPRQKRFSLKPGASGTAAGLRPMLLHCSLNRGSLGRGSRRGSCASLAVASNCERANRPAPRSLTCPRTGWEICAIQGWASVVTQTEQRASAQRHVVCYSCSG